MAPSVTDIGRGFQGFTDGIEPPAIALATICLRVKVATSLGCFVWNSRTVSVRTEPIAGRFMWQSGKEQFR